MPDEILKSQRRKLSSGYQFCGNFHSILRESAQMKWPGFSKGLSNGTAAIGTRLARIKPEPIFE
jgi:hypothetical protein